MVNKGYKKLEELVNLPTISIIVLPSEQTTEKKIPNGGPWPHTTHTSCNVSALHI